MHPHLSTALQSVSTKHFSWINVLERLKHPSNGYHMSKYLYRVNISECLYIFFLNQQ